MARKGVASAINEEMEKASADTDGRVGANLLLADTHRGIKRESFVDEAGAKHMLPEVEDEDGNVHHVG